MTFYEAPRHSPQKLSVISEVTQKIFTAEAELVDRDDFCGAADCSCRSFVSWRLQLVGWLH